MSGNGSGELDLVLKYGTVVFKDYVRTSDIGIQAGKIVMLGELDHVPAAEIADAGGLVIMPGMIDAHVHLNEPGLGAWEGFQSGSAALAAGGCTTYLDMPLNGVPPTVSVAAMERKLAAANGRSYVDFALWGGLVPGKLDEIIPLHKAGVIGYKAFMSNPGGEGEDIFREVDDYTLLEGMKRIAEVGKVLALHAESEPIVSRLEGHMRRSGRVEPGDYSASRPIVAELEAINRALFYAGQTGCPLHFVHISSAAGVRMIVDARRRGLDVTVETCPHYLALSEDSLYERGAVAKCAPPLRSAEEQEKLWDVVAAGLVNIVASDHSPCPEEMKSAEHIFDAWGGIAGAQSSMELMVGEGHVKRDIPLHLLGRMLSYEPAKRFGLQDSKGSIRIGADADLALLDTRQSYTLEREHLLQKHKLSPYIGRQMHSRVVATYSRGRKVYEASSGLIGGMDGKWLKHSSVRA